MSNQINEKMMFSVVHKTTT